MNDIEALTNRVILIGKGKLLYDGSFNKIKNKYRDKITIDLELYDEISDFAIDGYEVVNNTPGMITVKPCGDTKFNIIDFTQQVYGKYNLKDINVNHLNLEEIIYELYKEYNV